MRNHKRSDKRFETYACNPWGDRYNIGCLAAIRSHPNSLAWWADWSLRHMETLFFFCSFAEEIRGSDPILQWFAEWIVDAIRPLPFHPHSSGFDCIRQQMYGNFLTWVRQYVPVNCFEQPSWWMKAVSIYIREFPERVSKTGTAFSITLVGQFVTSSP